MTKSANSRKATPKTSKSTDAHNRQRASVSTPSTKPPRKSKLWNFRRIATLNYLFTTGRDKYHLTKQEIETLFNNLHDVTGERSGEMEHKTLQTQMNEKKRSDKTLPVVWQQVLGIWPGPADERRSLTVQKKDQVKLVSEAVKEFKGLHGRDVDDSEDSDEEDEEDEEAVENGALTGADEAQLEDNTFQSRGQESDEEEEEEEGKGDDEAERRSTALRPSLGDLARFLVNRQRSGRNVESNDVDENDPFALLDDVSVSADECLLPVDEESEAIRRDAGFYDTAEN